MRQSNGLRRDGDGVGGHDGVRYSHASILTGPGGFWEASRSPTTESDGHIGDRATASACEGQSKRLVVDATNRKKGGIIAVRDFLLF